MRLRRLQRKYFPASGETEPVNREGGNHHHIGRSETLYDEIGAFLQQRSGDPAVKVSLIIYNDSYLTSNGRAS